MKINVALLTVTKNLRRIKPGRLSFLLRSHSSLQICVLLHWNTVARGEGFVAMHIPSKLTERNSKLNCTNTMHLIHLYPPFRNNYFPPFFPACRSCDALSKLNYICSFKSVKKMNENRLHAIDKGQRDSEWQNSAADSCSKWLLNRTKYSSA